MITLRFFSVETFYEVKSRIDFLTLEFTVLTFDIILRCKYDYSDICLDYKLNMRTIFALMSVTPYREKKLLAFYSFESILNKPNTVVSMANSTNTKL